jgi:predicted DNA-binding ribbon-helix-helix protein
MDRNKTLKVDEQTHQDLKVLAAQQRKTIAALIAELVRREKDKSGDTRQNIQQREEGNQ